MTIVRKLIEKGQAVITGEGKEWPDYRGIPLDRTKFVSASEIGGCARKIKYGKYFPDISNGSYGFAERGHSAEAWILSRLRRSGAQLMLIGDDQRSVWDNYQSGTPDGVLLRPDGNLLLEFKCIDPRTNWNALPKPPHVKQDIQNIDLVNICYEGLDIRRGVITYIDATNYENIRDYYVDFDPAEADKLEARAKTIMEAKSPADLPAEGVYTGDCKWCPFTEQCNGAVEHARREQLQREEQENVARYVFR